MKRVNFKSPNLILVLLLVGVVASTLLLFMERKSGAPQSEKDSAAMMFQPDSQTLDHAVNPDAESKTPGPALGNTMYVYDTNACKGQDSNCFQTFYRDLTKKYGVDAAFFDIKKRYNENPVVMTGCHPLMHIIGEEASNYYPVVSEAYLHGDSFCWSGYYHGIMEGVVEKIGLAALPAKLNTICDGIPGKASYNFDYFNCVHGLGHGIMESLGDDVPKSLAMCDNLQGDWEEQSCYGGVFMENIISNDKEHDSKFLDPKKPLYPCDIVNTKYKYQCYLGQTSYALEVNNYNFQKVYDMCTTVEEPFRDICDQSIGRDAANQAHHEKLATKATCDMGATENDINNCVIGAVKEIISFYHSDKQAADYCNVYTGKTASVCKDTAEKYYKLF